MIQLFCLFLKHFIVILIWYCFSCFISVSTYQKHIFSLIEAWLKQPGRAVISVVHDLSLAQKYGTHAVLMDRGRCAAQGKTAEVMTRERLEAVYGMDVYGWMRDLLGQWA